MKRSSLHKLPWWDLQYCMVHAARSLWHIYIALAYVDGFELVVRKNPIGTLSPLKFLLISLDSSWKVI